MSESGWLDDISIDWNDFDNASRISGEIVRHVAADRALLRRMVLDAQQDGQLRELSEKHHELTYIVLYDALDRGLRVRLNRFTKGLEDIPHNHRFSFSSALLSGSYVHTLFDVGPPDAADPGQKLWALDQPEGTHGGQPVKELEIAGLHPVLATVQRAGSSYTLHHTTIHKTAMPDETAFSVFCRGPAQKPCALQLQPDAQTYMWKFGRANETSDVLADRRLTEDEYSAFIESLEKADVV